MPIGVNQYTFTHQKEGLFQTYFYVDDVDSKPEAVEFYKRFKFLEINKEENSETMFMVCDIAKPSEVNKVI